MCSQRQSHQIKEMRKQGDMQYQQSGNVQNEQRPDNNKNQPQLVDSSCQDNFVSTSQVMQYPQSEDVLKEHQPDNSQFQLQLVDTSHLDNSGDDSAATSQDLQSPQSGNVQKQVCSSKSYPQMDNYKYQLQLVDMSCKDNSAATSQYLQFPQSGNVRNGHQPDNNKNQPQLVDSSCQDDSLASYLQSPQSGNVQNGHQTDNNKNQPQLVGRLCLDDSVATSEAMQYSQSEKVQNQHQPDNNKYQPQLVDTSCLDNSVATSEANNPQSDNIQNRHCSGQPYPHLDIRTSQPQQVDTSHQESSTSREDLDSTSNRQDVKQSPQGLMKSNQDQTNKPYLQLDIRIYLLQRVDTSCQESSDDQTSREELVSTINQQDKQSPQWLIVPNQQQTSKPYPQLDIRNYQWQQVDTSRQESSDDQTSREELVSTKQFPQWLIVQNQQQTSKPYPQQDIRIYQPQPVDTSPQESNDDPSSGKELVSTIDKVKSGAVYHALAQLEVQHVKEAALLSEMKIQTLEPTTSYPPELDDQYAAVPEHIQDILKCASSELTQYFHLQGSSFIEGIAGDTCTLINYWQKAVMVTSSEGSDPETSRIWDPGGTTRFVKRRD